MSVPTSSSAIAATTALALAVAADQHALARGVGPRCLVVLPGIGIGAGVPDALQPVAGLAQAGEQLVIHVRVVMLPGVDQDALDLLGDTGELSVQGSHFEKIGSCTDNADNGFDHSSGRL